MNTKHQKWANALRNKYNNILAQNGELCDQDYENMVSDAGKCIVQDKSCQDAIFSVLEEFDKRSRPNDKTAV